MNRRHFIVTAAAATGAGLIASRAARAGASEDAAYPPLPKAIQYNKLPEGLSDAGKFALAKDLGFDGVEMAPMDDLEAAAARGAAAREAGVEIHSIIYGGWGAPMSSPNPAVIRKGHAEIENALRTAAACGADTVLLVPGVVTEQVGYGMAWENSQKNIRPMLPLAEELGVVIAVENVWNRFLLSPLEFAAYVEAFDSPWLQAYFDVGNVVLFGFPQDWIRTLGARIRRIHWKDFRREDYTWTDLYEGSVNWPEVRKALHEIGYTGWGTEEQRAGDEDYLRELSRRLSLIGAGAANP